MSCQIISLTRYCCLLIIYFFANTMLQDRERQFQSTLNSTTLHSNYSTTPFRSLLQPSNDGKLILESSSYKFSLANRQWFATVFTPDAFTEATDLFIYSFGTSRSWEQQCSAIHHIAWQMSATLSPTITSLNIDRYPSITGWTILYVDFFKTRYNVEMWKVGNGK